MEVTGAPGSVSPVRTHPGSEAFFVLAGEQSIRSSHGLLLVKVGQAEAGHGADMPMQVESSGSTDLHSLVMFVVDATKPFHLPPLFREYAGRVFYVLLATRRVQPRPMRLV